MTQYDKTKKYWLQLKDDWFDEDAIKWIEDQKNGKEYSLFYLKLMVKSIRTNGFLIRKVGTMLIPYDSQALSDLTRTDVDTVIVAMGLLEKTGLVQILEDGAIYIEQVQKMIGFTTIGAEKKAIQRDIKQEILTEWTSGGQMSTKDIIKDKDITIDKDIDIYMCDEHTPKSKKFIPPTFEDVKKYCLERKNNVDAKKWWNFYNAKDWYIGKTKMKNWKSAIITWEKTENKKQDNSFEDSFRTKAEYMKDWVNE